MAAFKLMRWEVYWCIMFRGTRGNYLVFRIWWNAPLKYNCSATAMLFKIILIMCFMIWGYLIICKVYWSIMQCHLNNTGCVLTLCLSYTMRPPRCITKRHGKSFQPVAINLYNSSPFCRNDSWNIRHSNYNFNIMCNITFNMCKITLSLQYHCNY